MLYRMVRMAIKLLLSMRGLAVYCCFCTAILIEVYFNIQKCQTPINLWFTGERDVLVHVVNVVSEFLYMVLIE